MTGYGRRSPAAAVCVLIMIPLMLTAGLSAAAGDTAADKMPDGETVEQLKEQFYFTEESEALRKYYTHKMWTLRYRYKWDYDYAKPVVYGNPVDTDWRRFEVIWFISLPVCFFYNYFSLMLYTSLSTDYWKKFIYYGEVHDFQLDMPQWLFLGSGTVLLSYLIARHDHRAQHQVSAPNLRVYPLAVSWHF